MEEMWVSHLSDGYTKMPMEETGNQPMECVPIDFHANGGNGANGGNSANGNRSSSAAPSNVVPLSLVVMDSQKCIGGTGGEPFKCVPKDYPGTSKTYPS